MNKRKLAELERKLAPLAVPRNRAGKREARFIAATSTAEKVALYNARKRALGIPDEAAIPFKYGSAATFTLESVLPFIEDVEIRQHLEQLANELLTKRKSK